jgi:hypothetical protein
MPDGRNGLRKEAREIAGAVRSSSWFRSLHVVARVLSLSRDRKREIPIEPPVAEGVTREVNRKQALEQLPVVGHAKAQKLMNDHVILENEGFFEQRLGKADILC